MLPVMSPAHPDGLLTSACDVALLTPNTGLLGLQDSETLQLVWEHSLLLENCGPNTTASACLTILTSNETRLWVCI
jgi:hypothetical protein